MESGNRWSKPHVGTASLHALFELRRGIATGSTLVCLDVNATHGCMPQVGGKHSLSDTRIFRLNMAAP